MMLAASTQDIYSIINAKLLVSRVQHQRTKWEEIIYTIAMHNRKVHQNCVVKFPISRLYSPLKLSREWNACQ
jgi:hypothetical protein